MEQSHLREVGSFQLKMSRSVLKIWNSSVWVLGTMHVGLRPPARALPGFWSAILGLKELVRV